MNKKLPTSNHQKKKKKDMKLKFYMDQCILFNVIMG